jgi:hypothetical protein
MHGQIPAPSATPPVDKFIKALYCTVQCTKSIEWFIEGQTFARSSYDLSPRPMTVLPLLLSVISTGDAQEDCERETTDTLLMGGGGRVLARSRIIIPKESLVLYKSFNTLRVWERQGEGRIPNSLLFAWKCMLRCTWLGTLTALN